MSVTQFVLVSRRCTCHALAAWLALAPCAYASTPAQGERPGSHGPATGVPGLGPGLVPGSAPGTALGAVPGSALGFVPGFGLPAAPGQLERERGGSDAIVTNAALSGAVTGNSATQVVTGGNTIQASSFAGASGIPIVIQNTGANVLIQNATVINLQMK